MNAGTNSQPKVNEQNSDDVTSQPNVSDVDEVEGGSSNAGAGQPIMQVPSAVPAFATTAPGEESVSEEEDSGIIVNIPPRSSTIGAVNRADSESIAPHLHVRDHGDSRRHSSDMEHQHTESGRREARSIGRVGEYEDSGSGSLAEISCSQFAAMTAISSSCASSTAAPASCAASTASDNNNLQQPVVSSSSSSSSAAAVASPSSVFQMSPPLASSSAATSDSSASLSPCSSISSVELMALDIHKLKTSTKFSYATLVAVILGDCCRSKVLDANLDETEREKSIVLHSVYLKDFFHGLKNHLELPESIEHTLYSHAMNDDSVKLVADYVTCLELDPILKPAAESENAGSMESVSSSKDSAVTSSNSQTPSKSAPSKLPSDSGTAVLILDALQLSIRKGDFDARSREMCMRLNKALGYLPQHYELQESSFVDFMQTAAQQYEMSSAEKDAQKKSKRKAKRNRFIAIGLAAVGGGALIGLTGGLAAPLVAGGLAAIIGGAGATFLVSSAGIAVITSVFGAGGAGLVGYKMKRRVGNVEQFEFSTLTDGVGLHVAIAIPGWIREGEVISQQWSALDISPEQYCLMWETKYLLELGSSLQYLKDTVVSAAMSQALKLTVLGAVMAAITWPAALLSASSVIDNPWSVANSRSVQAGKQLAEVLLTRQHGCRPVTLVGVSLGAKLIYHCLEEMLDRGSSALGVIQDIVIVGSPCTGRPQDWIKLTPLVAGRIVNAYSKGDWMLKFIYRSSSMRSKIAGLGPIPLEPKIVNIDLTDKVNGHLDYLDKMPEVLSYCGVKCRQFTKSASNKFSLSNKASSAGSSPAKSKQKSESGRSSISGDSGAVQERNDGSGRNSRIGEKDSKNDSWEDLSEEQQSTSAL